MARLDRDQIREWRERMLPAAAAYAREVVGPALGERGDPAVAIPADGRHSVVYFLEWPSGRRAVLRGADKGHELKLRAEASRLFRKVGIATPRVLLEGFDRATRERYRQSFLTEDFARGAAPKSIQAVRPAAAALGALLARVHRRVGRRHGLPREQPIVGLGRASEGGLRARVDEWLAIYGRHKKAQPDAVRAFLDAVPADRWMHRPRLVVGNLVHSNLLIDDAGVAIIDLDTVHYGFAAMELAQVRLGWFFDDADAHAEFLAAYRSGADAALRDENARCAVLGEALHHLSQAARELYWRRWKLHHVRLLEVCGIPR